MLLLVVLFVYLNLFDDCMARQKIFGGQEVNITQCPYQVSVRWNNNHICGGVLISDRFALSATHCFVAAGAYTIRAGSTNLTDGGIIVPIITAILHPNLNLKNQDNDIAILKLDSSLSFSPTIQPAMLPQEDETLMPGWFGVVSGWGTVSNELSNNLSRTLRAVTLPIQSLEWCQSRYVYVPLTSRMFCAGFKEGGRDSCQGDSGGPFVINGTVYGIISWGFNCAQPGYPGVYTNVAAFRKYIKLNSGI